MSLTPNNSSFVCVFPGQGSHKLGMAKDFFETFTESREIFSTASNATQLDIADLCFKRPELLDLTEYAQPAILTAELAIYFAVKNQKLIRFEYFAGHSLGEYAALAAAQVLDLASVFKIVRKRGQLMQSVIAPKDSAMAALISEKLNIEAIEDQCKRNDCVIANYNSAHQVVVSGNSTAVKATVEQLESEVSGLRSVFLKVSAPFHSPVMHTIEAEFAQYLKSFKFCLENSDRVFSNFSGELHSQDSIMESLARQISSPVQWLSNMQAIISLGLPIIEVGPQRVLSKFFNTLGVEVASVTDLRSFGRLA